MRIENRIFTYLFRAAILCAAYFVSAKFGLTLTYSAEQISLVWPAAGIALAALLLFGWNLWPGIFLGAFAINFWASGLLLSSLEIALGNTLAAVIGVLLLCTVKGFDASFLKVRDYVWFVLYGAMLPTLASAFIGVGSLALANSISVSSWGDFFSFFRIWWVGDALGVLVFAPVFLVWPHVKAINQDSKRLAEAGVLFLSSALAGFIIFNNTIPYLGVFLPPFTLLAAVRFYQPGAAIMTLLLSAISILGTVHGMGPFANFENPETGLFFSRIFVGIMAVASMAVALIMFEKEKAVEEWKKLSLLLHEKISEQAEKLGIRAHELQEYIDHMSIFTAKVAPDGSLLAVSQATEEAAGLMHEDLMKTNFLEGAWFTFDPHVSARVRDAFERAVSGEPVQYDEQILVFGTSLLWINFGLVPVAGKDGKTAFIIAEGLDITKRKKLENDLEQARHEMENKVAERTEELHRANNALTEEVNHRDQFLATLSHELRNPLAPIMSTVEMLRMTHGDNPELKKHLEVLERQTNVLARLLKDLLDVSRLAYQKIDLEIRSVDVGNVMKSAIETVRPFMEKCGHTLSVSFPEDPIVIEGDALRIEQIIVNLLNNAVKYTPEGGQISLRGRMENEKAVITVKDSGIGISAKMLPKIFTLFSQDKKSLGMANRRLGIALALAKALAELHGGTITASSEGTGKGAVFEVVLPLKQKM